MSLDMIAIQYGMLRQQYEKRLNSLQRTHEYVPEPVAKRSADEFLDIQQIWNDAESVLKSNKFFALSLCGPQGSGKTTIAEELAELAEQEGFKVIYAFPEDFMTDMDGWISRVREVHADRNFLVIDDLSYATDTAKRADQAKVKNAVARFRKIFMGEVFVVYITHRLHAAPPMLRNSGSWIFTTMQPADREDAQKVVGRTKEMRERLEALYSLISDIAVRGPKEKTITLQLGETPIEFVWGTEEDPGDGRLMAAYHSGKLGVFCSRATESGLDLEKYRYPDKSGSALFELD